MPRQLQYAVIVSSLVMLQASNGVAQARDSTAVITGRILRADGTVLTEAIVHAGARGAVVNSAGVYRIDRVPTGASHVRARRIGYTSRDTTITLKSGETRRWDVVLEESTWGRPSASDRLADSMNIANGAVDSAAAGLLPKRAAGDPPYERFGARLLASIAKERGLDANTVISPLSAGMALALVATGTRGPTYAALARTLDAGTLDVLALAKRDSAMLVALSGRSDITLEIANALWMSPRYEIQREFIATAERAFRSRVSTVDMAQESGIDTINAWANEKSHGKIPKILSAPLDPSTAIVVTNAVYFYGRWLTAFDSNATRPLAFHSRPGRIDTVPAMERTASLAYLRGNGMQAIRLPYRGGRAALFVILPDSGVSIGAVEARLATVALPQLSSEYQWREVHLRLPRVRAEATMDLVAPLEALGAGIAFQCGAADFRAMIVLGAEEHACIDKATQKTYIDIDEKGTEAVAVTLFSVGVTAVAQAPPPIEFIVDRPFLFVLRDEVSGVPLFMGRIVAPGTSMARVR